MSDPKQDGASRSESARRAQRAGTILFWVGAVGFGGGLILAVAPGAARAGFVAVFVGFALIVLGLALRRSRPDQA